MLTSRRLACTISLLLLGLTDACSRDKATPGSVTPPPPPAGSAVMQIDERVHDFGVVNRGSELVHVFTIANPGNAVLKIENVSTSCGCTAATLDSDQIPPGGRGTLAVRMSTQGFLGPGSKGIQVAGNDPRNPTVSLEIKYDVQRLVVFDPSFVALTSKRGHKHVEKVWLAGDLAEQAKPRVLEVRGGDDQVSVKVWEERRDGRTQRGLELRLAGTKPIAASGEVTISTGLPNPAELVLRFNVLVDG